MTNRATTTAEDASGSTWEGMDAFYATLRDLPADRTFVHIAYFGDSMIEGDLVTMQLRHRLQKRFGGSGVGFVPLTTPLPGFRTTVLQSFNDAWEVVSFVRQKAGSGIVPGISGYAYRTAPGARAAFAVPKTARPFRQATLLFGGSSPIRAEIRTDSAAGLVTLDPDRPVSRFRVQRDSAFRSLELRILSEEPGIVYGVNFEGAPGVYVDNYAFRGHSGLPMTSIPAALFEGFNQALHNRLLILHFGLNVYTPGVEDYHWYEAALGNVIRHVRQCSPGISLLVISMPDRSAPVNGAYHTPAELPGFISMQKRVALREHVAFFNLFEAMGGAESMKQWVEGRPKLAGDDYTHPNGAGAARIAALVNDYLMQGYEQFLRAADTSSHSLPSSPGL